MQGWRQDPLIPGDGRQHVFLVIRGYSCDGVHVLNSRRHSCSRLDNKAEVGRASDEGDNVVMVRVGPGDINAVNRVQAVAHGQAGLMGWGPDHHVT